MVRLAILTVGLAVWAGVAMAQIFPVRENLRVNDYADLLDPSTEADLTAKLNQIQADIGTDMTVLTIRSRSDYGDAPNIERFATDLFNTWGIGSQDNNSGILILVARDDREMRIELGESYPPIYDEISENVIDGAFLPAFREDNYQDGIVAGVDRAIQRIAGPFARGEEVRADPKGGLSGSTLGLLIAGGLGIAGIGGTVAYRIRRKCPQCGQQSLNRKSRTIVSATRHSTGSGETHMTCEQCGFDKLVPYVLAKISDNNNNSSGGGFSSGGGSSSGGGASGRW